MEYQRQHDEIQAGFALHAARLLWQYEILTRSPNPSLAAGDGERYEGTLTVCVLQALLTQCTELLDFLSNDIPTKEFFGHDISKEPHPWGVSQALVTRNTFPGSVTLRRLLTHMRNALSHPSFGGAESEIPPTGYPTVGSPAGSPIVTYQFTVSPWVKNGRRRHRGRQVLPCNTEGDAQDLATQFNERRPVDDHLFVIANPDGTFDLGRDGKVYWPIFQIELPLVQLRKLAIELANYLANKTLRDWDGRTIHRFVPELAA
jgi:hypothetical protein